MLHTRTVIVMALCTGSAALADSGSDEGGIATARRPADPQGRTLTKEQVVIFDRDLRGRTLIGVTSLLGPPDCVRQLDADRAEWWYQFGGESLIVTIHDGQAVGAGDCIVNREEQERQTGVREDDFGGLGAP